MEAGEVAGSTWQSKLSVWRQRARARSNEESNKRRKMVESAGKAVVGLGAVIVVAVLVALLPVVVLGGLALLLTALLIVTVSGFVSIGGALYFYSRSNDQRNSRPQRFVGTSFHVFEPSETH